MLLLRLQRVLKALFGECEILGGSVAEPWRGEKWTAC